jgi:hypothetical protein
MARCKCGKICHFGFVTDGIKVACSIHADPDMVNLNYMAAKMSNDGVVDKIANPDIALTNVYLNKYKRFIYQDTEIEKSLYALDRIDSLKVPSAFKMLEMLDVDITLDEFKENKLDDMNNLLLFLESENIDVCILNNSMAL